MAQKIRIGALISGGGTNLQAIIDACEKGKINGKLVFVGSDNPYAGGLSKARSRKIPTFIVNYAFFTKQFKENPTGAILPKDFDLEEIYAKQFLTSHKADTDKIRFYLQSRAIAEAQLLAEMKPYPFDLLVLAGFMRNLTPYFIDRINTIEGSARIMNIHPALLPSFPGVDGYGDTYGYGCKIGGCTVHFIDYGEDTGPIIGQSDFQISEEDTLETVKKKGLALEWKLYPECINLFAQGRLRIVRKTYMLANDQKFDRTVVKILKHSEI
jgi:phosphoribosylglycinamide formyltransferase-1